jgi:hypothetical protein
MLDDSSGIHVFERFEGHTMALLLFFNPCDEGLFDHPPPRPLHALGKLVDLMGKRGGYVRGQHASFIILNRT